MAIYDLTGTEAIGDLRGDLAVVIPVFNEAANIREVVESWRSASSGAGVKTSFILIDDGSKDGTAEILAAMQSEDPALVVLRKPNSGHGRSCRLGYDLCAKSSVPWVLQIDSDGQCDPAYFGEFWSKRTEADCVFGVRKQRDDGLARTLTSKVCRWSSTLLCGVDMVDPNVPYRLLRREVLASALNSIPPGFDIHNVALTFVLKRAGNLRWSYVPIRFKERQGGSNSINLLNVGQLGFSMLFDLLRLRKKTAK